MYHAVGLRTPSSADQPNPKPAMVFAGFFPSFAASPFAGRVLRLERGRQAAEAYGMLVAPGAPVESGENFEAVVNAGTDQTVLVLVRHGSREAMRLAAAEPRKGLIRIGDLSGTNDPLSADSLAGYDFVVAGLRSAQMAVGTPSGDLAVPEATSKAAADLRSKFNVPAALVIAQDPTFVTAGLSAAGVDGAPDAHVRSINHAEYVAGSRGAHPVLLGVFFAKKVLTNDGKPFTARTFREIDTVDAMRAAVTAAGFCRSQPDLEGGTPTFQQIEAFSSGSYRVGGIQAGEKGLQLLTTPGATVFEEEDARQKAIGRRVDRLTRDRPGYIPNQLQELQALVGREAWMKFVRACTQDSVENDLLRYSISRPVSDMLLLRQSHGETIEIIPAPPSVATTVTDTVHTLHQGPASPEHANELARKRTAQQWNHLLQFPDAFIFLSRLGLSSERDLQQQPGPEIARGFTAAMHFRFNPIPLDGNLASIILGIRNLPEDVQEVVTNELCTLLDDTVRVAEFEGDRVLTAEAGAAVLDALARRDLPAAITSGRSRGGEVAGQGLVG